MGKKLPIPYYIIVHIVSFSPFLYIKFFLINHCTRTLRTRIGKKWTAFGKMTHFGLGMGVTSNRKYTVVEIVKNDAFFRQFSRCHKLDKFEI
jgi:hypothetical protein